MLLKLIISALLIFLLTPNSWSYDISITPENPKQGDVILIRIISYDGDTPEGSLMDKKLHFYKKVSGDFIALAGVDMKTSTGAYQLSISLDENIFKRDVKVISGLFEIQRLSLPKRMVELDAKTLKRVKVEAARLVKLWPVMNERLWEERFIMPLQGEISSPFGARRIINKQEKSPHGGIDIRAKEADPIIAPNNGKIALTDDQFLGGKTVVLDHGYGIYSVFFHLSKIAVIADQIVRRGDLIGFAGATGRATGPHLHWGVRIQGQRINPLSLIDLDL
ncbi:MAG: M23 family metallopeptidase [Nitrospirae bacterium]|nr:M23 family metallopeptidase [Nitrospirota bacterium]